MKSDPIILFVILSVAKNLTSGLNAQQPGWPLAPQDSIHPLGNNWGEFQDYGGNPYMHPGIDVIGDPEAVYSVSHGWVKAWLTTGGQYYWRVAVGDSSGSDSCDGWLFAHIDPNLYHVNEGDEVYPADLLGYLIDWPVTGFTHCHFARIRNAGVTWSSNWLFVENPLNLINPNTDTESPVFEIIPAVGKKFAFCVNNTSTYLEPDSLYGDVDIIARIYDKLGPTLSNPVWERLIPYAIEYSIRGQVNILPTIQCAFAHWLDYNNTGKVNTCYKDDGICDSRGDYDYRVYHFIVTNTDGDSILEVSDTSGCWRTLDFPDGDYWVKVTAYDQYGNAGSDSMLVTVDNYEFYEDVGVVSINSPPDSVYYDSTYPLIAVIKNWGELTETFDVNCKLYFAKQIIDTTITIDNLIPDSTLQVSFGGWLVDSAPATYEMKVVTLLPTDMWQSNDTLACTITSTTVGVEEVTSKLSYTLAQNQPNPFSTKTVIRVQVPDLRPKKSNVCSLKSLVSLKIYDLAGRVIRVWDLGFGGWDFQEVVWDGKDSSGKIVPNGIYFYKLESLDFSHMKKIILIR